MTRPTRRLLLGASAALAAPIVPAAAGAAPSSPDAALIRNCARFLHLDARVNAYGRPPHPEPEKEEAEAAEFTRLIDELEEADPQTMEGAVAMARVALLCAFTIDESPWDGFSGRVARNAVCVLAGPGAIEEEARLYAQYNARIAASFGSKTDQDPEPALLPAPPPPLSLEERAKGLRLGIAFTEPRLAEMKAELAALEGGA